MSVGLSDGLLVDLSAAGAARAAPLRSTRLLCAPSARTPADLMSHPNTQPCAAHLVFQRGRSE